MERCSLLAAIYRCAVQLTRRNVLHSATRLLLPLRRYGRPKTVQLPDGALDGLRRSRCGRASAVEAFSGMSRVLTGACH
jgi:hypothetical protein